MSGSPRPPCKSLIAQACLARWLDISLVPSCVFMDLDAKKKEFGQYPTILIHALSITRRRNGR